MPRYRVVYYDANKHEYDRDYFASKEYAIGMALTYENVRHNAAIVVDEETGEVVYG